MESVSENDPLAFGLIGRELFLVYNILKIQYIKLIISPGIMLARKLRIQWNICYNAVPECIPG